MEFKKGHLIDDDGEHGERREYERLAALAQAVLDNPYSAESFRRSVALLVWERYEGLRRAADSASPPDRIAWYPPDVWAGVRHNARRALEAYEELLEALVPRV